MIDSLDDVKMRKLCAAYEVIAKELDLTIDEVIESFEFTVYDTSISQKLLYFYHYEFDVKKQEEHEPKILNKSIKNMS